jgi:hypothetical protein
MAVDDELLSWIVRTQTTPARKAFFAVMNFRPRTVTLRLRRLLENGTALICEKELHYDEILLQHDWRIAMARILRDMRKELRLAEKSTQTKEISEEAQ